MTSSKQICLTFSDEQNRTSPELDPNISVLFCFRGTHRVVTLSVVADCNIDFCLYLSSHGNSFTHLQTFNKQFLVCEITIHDNIANNVHMSAKSGRKCGRKSTGTCLISDDVKKTFNLYKLNFQRTRLAIEFDASCFVINHIQI